MGITGLLKALKPITFDVLLPDYKGMTAGVDGHAWLHRAAYGCARAVVKGLKCDTYVNYVMKNIRALHNSGVTPIVVFDGGPLPMKKEENQKRRQLRKQNKEKALQLEASGDLQGAESYYQQSISITFQMVMNCVAALKQNNVQYIIAPYEGDSQLAYMFISGMVDFCITEDSDLLVFGVRNIFTKLNHSLGTGRGINLDRLKTYKAGKKEKGPTDLCKVMKCFRDHLDFVHMAVLSGCDYLNSLRGIGLYQAAKRVKEWKDIGRLLHDMRKRKDWTKEYEHDFERATLTYLHQRVYCTKRKKLVHVTPLSKRMDEFIAAGKENFDVDESAMDFLGPSIPPNQAQAIAEGRIDPHSRVSVFMPSSKFKIPAFKAEIRQPTVKEPVDTFARKNVVAKRPEWLNKSKNEKSENRSILLAPPPVKRSSEIDDIVSQYTSFSSKRFGRARSRNAFSKTPRSKINGRKDHEMSRRGMVRSPFQKSTMSGSFLSIEEVGNVTPIRSVPRFGLVKALETTEQSPVCENDTEMDWSNASPILAKPKENLDTAAQPIPIQEAKREIHLTRRILKPLKKSARKSAREKRKFRKRNKSCVWSFGKLDWDLDESKKELTSLPETPLKKQKVKANDQSLEQIEHTCHPLEMQQVEQMNTSVEMAEPDVAVGVKRAKPVSLKRSVDITNVLPDRPLKKKRVEEIEEGTNPCSPEPAGGFKKTKPTWAKRGSEKTKVKATGKKKGNDYGKTKESGKKQRSLLSFFTKAS